MKFLAQLVVSALAVIVTSLLMPGVKIDGPLTALVVAAVLSFLNSIVKPLLVILTIPITLFTLGFFLLIINAIIIMIASHLVHGFEVSGFWTALFFSIVLTLVTYIFNSFTQKDEEE